MKKLLILLFAAAVIGVVISKVRGDVDEAPAEAQAEEDAVAVAEAKPPEPPDFEPALASHPRPAAQLNAQRPASRPSSVAFVAVGTPKEAAPAGRPPEQAALAPGPDSEPAPVRVKKIDPVPAHPQRTHSQKDGALSAAIGRASSLIKAGRRVEARKILSDLYLKARGHTARQLRTVLDEINRDLIFNPRCTEGAKIHVVEPGETLSKIGKQYGQSWQMIQRVNGMTHDRINVGQQLKILEGEVGALVVLSEFRLTMLIDGVYAKEYPIGIGMGDKTPPGEFVVDTMLVEPRWYKPGGGVVEYGEEGHLLGERWIGFEDQPGAAGLGIHGTNDESTIGTKCSNGCLRMRRDDVIELYDFMRRGSKVVVRP